MKYPIASIWRSKGTFGSRELHISLWRLNVIIEYQPRNDTVARLFSIDFWINLETQERITRDAACNSSRP
jgi:hypothetical protein